MLMRICLVFMFFFANSPIADRSVRLDDVIPKDPLGPHEAVCWPWPFIEAQDQRNGFFV